MRIALLITYCFASCFVLSFNSSNDHILLDQVRNRYKTEIGSECDTFVVYKNDKQTAERVNFLNKDFNTRLFSLSNSVAYWECYTFDKQNEKKHIGIVSFSFKNKKDLTAAINKIKSTKRHVLKVIVLTRFVIKDLGNELIVVYSETTYKNAISRLMDTI